MEKVSKIHHCPSGEIRTEDTAKEARFAAGAAGNSLLAVGALAAKVLELSVAERRALWPSIVTRPLVVAPLLGWCVTLLLGVALEAILKLALNLSTEAFATCWNTFISRLIKM